MRFALPRVPTLALAVALAAFLSCAPALAEEFDHADQGFELSLPDQWTESTPSPNTYVYQPGGARTSEPPLLVVRVQPFSTPEDAKKAASLAARVAAQPAQAVESAASVRLRGFTKDKEDLDTNSGAYDLEFTCSMAFVQGDLGGTLRTVPSTKGLFLVASLAAKDDAQSLAALREAMADMDIQGQTLAKGASTVARIMEALEGRGLMLLLSLFLTCFSLFAFFRFFRKDKTARTLIAHERARRQAVRKQIGKEDKGADAE